MLPGQNADVVNRLMLPGQNADVVNRLMLPGQNADVVNRLMLPGQNAAPSVLSYWYFFQLIRTTPTTERAEKWFLHCLFYVQ